MKIFFILFYSDFLFGVYLLTDLELAELSEINIHMNVFYINIALYCIFFILHTTKLLNLYKAKNAVIIGFFIVIKNITYIFVASNFCINAPVSNFLNYYHCDRPIFKQMIK